MRKIDLGGQWSLRSKSGSYAVPAIIPGDTHSALLQADKIADPFWADNELALQALNREDWIFERTFSIDQETLKEASIELHIDSVDTIGVILVNGAAVARTSNMFRACDVEIKPHLRPGQNVLRIEIESPEKAALARSKKLPYPLPYAGAPVKSPHCNLLRKVQCHSGWDWGPCLMVSGIYGGIYLAAHSLGKISSVTTGQKHFRGKVHLTVDVEIESPRGGISDLEIQLGEQLVLSPVKLKPGHNRFQKVINIERPKLWWPNGFGRAELYPLTVRVAGEEVRKRIGLRTLEVVNKPDVHGISLTFVVNGVPIFAKGANWIPCDALPGRQSRSIMNDLLTSAVDANMNMIRVWGGGQYESDDFYDLCDEKGLLLWHDFMFACALYPADDKFLASVRAEVTHQVKRLQHHPSIALWCGNNEDVGALTWFSESRENRDRYLVDYDRLNEGAIGNTVRQLDPGRLFWPSSPCAGPGDYSDNWHNDTKGDMHFWSVWHEGKPFEAYQDIKPRFCSEFGYQSFPSLETLRTCVPEDQLNPSSPIMEHHQRNGNGNAKILENMARYFRFPEGFENFVYLSQVQQAMAIRMAVEHFRRLRPICMGALYWQLNDLWPVASWSSLEYGGKWKILHYAAKRFFAPVMITARLTKENIVEIWGHNDRIEPIRGNLELRVLSFEGKAHHETNLAANVPGGSAKLLGKYSLAELTSSPKSTFLTLELIVDHEISRTELLFAAPKFCCLEKPYIEFTLRQKSEKQIEITLRTKRPALWVTLDVKNISGVFDDNGITLLPDRRRALFFTSKKKCSLADFRKQLSVKSLRDTFP